MARDTCRMPNCDREPEDGRFCSTEHEVKYDHLRADARDARASAEAEADRAPEKPMSDAEFQNMVL